MYELEFVADGSSVQEGMNVYVTNTITGELVNAEILLIEPRPDMGIIKLYLRSIEPEFNEIEDPKIIGKFLCILALHC